MSKGETTGDKFKIVTFQVIGTLLWLPEQAVMLGCKYLFDYFSEAGCVLV